MKSGRAHVLSEVVRLATDSNLRHYKCITISPPSCGNSMAPEKYTQLNLRGASSFVIMQLHKKNNKDIVSSTIKPKSGQNWRATVNCC